MYTNKFQIFLFLLCSTFFFHSCSDELADIGSEDFTQNGQEQEQSDRPNGNQEARNTDVVVQWMDLFLELDRYATGMRPNATARAIAYINLAAYEVAVPGLRGYVSNQAILPDLAVDLDRKRPRINWSIALNESYALTLDHFLIHLPSEKRDSIGLQHQRLEESLSRRLSNREIQESKDWGSYVANQVIAYSQTDHEAESQILSPQPTSYVPPSGPGFWTFSAEPERALFPYWESARTFIVPTSQTSTIEPLQYSEDPSSLYYADMMEVYQANNQAALEVDDQLWIAEFWSDDVENLVFSPPARQISIANQLVKTKRLPLDKTLYLYLKVGFALNDAAVAAWKYKYEHMVMRPSAYIQDHIDANYQTNLYRLIPWPNPTFPSYPSGHSTFASAAGGIFIDFFGNDITFTDQSHIGRTEFKGMPRTFKSFTEIIDENAFSRIPLGVHMRIDCTEGRRLGYEISDQINEYNLEIPNG